MNTQRIIIKDFVWITAMLVIAGFIRFFISSAGFFEDRLGLSGFLVIVVYFFVAFFIVRITGNCPLQKRKLLLWTLIILLTHAYLMEFLINFFIVSAKVHYWIVICAGAGGFAGILISLKYSGLKCNCNLYINSLKNSGLSDNFKPFTGIPGVPALITHHPRIPEIISKAFDWEAIFIKPDNDLQLALVCTGNSLVSLPHFSYGALFVRNGDEDPNRNIVSCLHKLHLEKRFNGFEYRYPLLNQDEKALKVVSWLKLRSNPTEQLQIFSANLRHKINKAGRNGLTVERGGVDLLDDFYKVYSRHIRSIGSGALPRRFFEIMLAEYDNAWVGIFLVKYKGEVIGGAFNNAYQGFYENGWFATLKPWQRLYPSYLLHSEMIAHAIELGCHTYSFGQSTSGSGVHRFKQQWKTYDVALRWIIHPQPKVSLRRYDWIRKIWKYLPYPLGNKFGNYIAKWVY